MISYGEWKTVTIPNGGTISGECNLGNWNYERLQVLLPTLDSGTIKIQVSDVSGGVFHDLGINLVTDITTGGNSDIFKLSGFQFIKIASSATQTADRVIKVRGVNE